MQDVENGTGRRNPPPLGGGTPSPQEECYPPPRKQGGWWGGVKDWWGGCSANKFKWGGLRGVGELALTLWVLCLFGFIDAELISYPPHPGFRVYIAFPSSPINAAVATVPLLFLLFLLRRFLRPCSGETKKTWSKTALPSLLLLSLLTLLGFVLHSSNVFVVYAGPGVCRGRAGVAFVVPDPFVVSKTPLAPALFGPHHRAWVHRWERLPSLATLCSLVNWDYAVTHNLFQVKQCAAEYLRDVLPAPRRSEAAQRLLGVDAIFVVHFAALKERRGFVEGKLREMGLAADVSWVTYDQVGTMSRAERCCLFPCGHPFDADDNNATKAISVSHLWIYFQMQEQKLERVLVLEDDPDFLPHIPFVSSVARIAAEVPADFLTVMLSGCWNIHADRLHAAPSRFTNGSSNAFARSGNGSAAVLFGPGYASRCTSAYLVSSCLATITCRACVPPSTADSVPEHSRLF